MPPRGPGRERRTRARAQRQALGSPVGGGPASKCALRKGLGATQSHPSRRRSFGSSRRAEMIRIVVSSWTSTWTTRRSRPSREQPTICIRRSACKPLRSGRTRARGSANTVAASSRVTPCLRRLVAAFVRFHTKARPSISSVSSPGPTRALYRGAMAAGGPGRPTRRSRFGQARAEPGIEVVSKHAKRRISGPLLVELHFPPKVGAAFCGGKSSAGDEAA
jgi:hypothetical protein